MPKDKTSHSPAAAPVGTPIVDEWGDFDDSDLDDIPWGDDDLDISLAPEISKAQKALDESASRTPHYEELDLEDGDDFGGGTGGVSQGYSLWKDTGAGAGTGTGKTTWGGAPAAAPGKANANIPWWRRGRGGTNPDTGAADAHHSAGTGKRGKGSRYGHSNYGNYYSYNYNNGHNYNYTRNSYASWYSGYNSARSAMRGVHRSASGYIRNAEFKRLAIYPSSSESVDYNDGKYSRLPGRDMHLRIEANLYDALGLEKAQQHYTVDTISQVLALEKMPNADLPRSLQNSDALLPRVTREVVTEVVRRRGLELLLAQAPGWSARIDSFRRAMTIKADQLVPPELLPTDPKAVHPAKAEANIKENAQKIATYRFNLLMHAAWLPTEALAVPEFDEAINVIHAIDVALSEGNIERRADLARKIISFVSASTGIVALASKIEDAIEVIRDELVEIVPFMPEPPVRVDSATRLEALFEEINRISHTLELNGPIKTQVESKIACATEAGFIGIRHSSTNPILGSIDELTEKLAVRRDKQVELDRKCDRLRVKYERILQGKHKANVSGERTDLTVHERLVHEGLSIMFAHCSVIRPILKVKPNFPAGLPQTAIEYWEALHRQLNDLRQEYHACTKDLLAAVAKADLIEDSLAKAINEMPGLSLEPWARFCSGALSESLNHLQDLLEDIHQKSTENLAGIDWTPGRDHEEGDGSGDDNLVIDEATDRHDGRGKDGSDGKGRGDRRHLKTNHEDLIVDADACSEELPSVGTDDEVKNPPEIVIYDASDPAVVCNH
jgi:hypothetical protein